MKDLINTYLEKVIQITKYYLRKVLRKLFLGYVNRLET